MVTVAKADDTLSVLLHFLRMLSFESWIITFKLKKICFPKADASRGRGLSRIFPLVLLASGGGHHGC